LRIALTGTRPEPLAQRLRAEGFTVVHRSLIRIEALEGPPIEASAYDWIVLTSRNAVACLFPRLAGPLPCVAVIGTGTAEALRAYGVEPDLVASRSTQEGLAAELPRPAGRVLFAGAEGARDVLVRELGADFVPLYRTVELHPDEFPAVDLVVLASPSAARALAAIRRDVPCVAVGPVTAAAARSVGLMVAEAANSPDQDGVLAAVKLAASRSVSSRS
jgi:uroporphyrinogen III methyltransferase / synthase